MKRKKVAPGTIYEITYALPTGTDEGLFIKHENSINKILTGFLGHYGRDNYTDLMLEHLERSLGGRDALRVAVKEYLGARGRREIDNEDALGDMGRLLAVHGPALRRYSAAEIIAHERKDPGIELKSLAKRFDKDFKEFEKERRENGVKSLFLFNLVASIRALHSIFSGNTSTEEKKRKLCELVKASWVGPYDGPMIADHLLNLHSEGRYGPDDIFWTIGDEVVDRVRAKLDGLIHKKARIK